ncbi:MAG TPA: prolyl oligopeptidase family serine peptidase [bacterium]|nr:prolyl oligopeptidase family serine peptidase [bacterium]
MFFQTLAAAILAATAAATPVDPAAAAAKVPLPDSPKKPVVDEYHGTKVTDDYRWLENWDDPTVKTWSEQQNAHARAYLEALPHRQEIHDRLEQILKSGSDSYGGLMFRGGILFAQKHEPKKQQPYLVTLKSADDKKSEKTLLDPNVIDPTGHTAIDFWVPSIDGKFVAVSLSKNGSESGDLHLYEVASGKEVGEVIPHVNNGTAGGSMAFTPDDKGFWYTRYPRGTEHAAADAGFYQQVYFHKIGTKTEDDVYELGKDLPKIAEIVVATTLDGKYVGAEVKNGDGGEVEYFVKPTDAPAGKWTQVSSFADRLVAMSFGVDGNAYFLSRKDAPRGKIVRIPLATPTIDKATVIVPESDGGIEGFTATKSKLYVSDLVGGPSRVRVFDLATGKQEKKDLPILEVSAVRDVVRVAADSDRVLFDNVSYLKPATWFSYDPKTAKATKTALFQTSIVNYDDAEIVREMVTSKDGTKVPVNILKKKSTKLDGTNPLILYAYGGYGVSQTPGFSGGLRVWLDEGGIWVVANIRGGGEFGDQWHLDGNLLKKQNDYDDFYACAEWLIAQKYTSREKLAILGGSNGGLLMGAALTQHPEEYRAVVSQVGVYDMLRVETTPNGLFNVTEYGSVKDPEQFKAMYAYSPLHRVQDGAKYPSIMLMTGANDPRVEPWHSRKFAARLQAANKSANPILLRTESDSGHGIGASIDQIIGERTDMFAFYLHELGVTWTPLPAEKGAPAKPSVR